MVNWSTNDAARSGAEAVGSHAMELDRGPLMQSGNWKAWAVRIQANKGMEEQVSGFMIHGRQAVVDRLGCMNE